MDEATCAQIPEQLGRRELRHNIVERGRRTRTIGILATLIAPDQYTEEETSQLFGFRWQSELDICNIRSSPNLGHVRCKSPQMVRPEVWTTILGYNLILATAAATSLLARKQPRQIRFTGSCQ